MILKIIFIILLMFAAFLAVYGIGAIIAMMFQEENQKACRNCRYYDAPMECYQRTWRKVIPGEDCNAFDKAKRED